MTPRVAIRATALVLAALGIVVGLTLYFSSEKTPPCLVSGVARWKAPTDAQRHRFEVVVPDGALCFFDMDDRQQLTGALALPGINGITAISPRPGGKLALRYADGRGAIVDLTTRAVQRGVEAPPAADGTARRSLSPDGRELWVLDARQNTIHVFAASGKSKIADIRLTRRLSGDESPCSDRPCARTGSLQHSNDGRFVYVGDSGDVFDAKRHEQVANLEALRNSHLTIEVDWIGGKPAFAGTR